MTRLLVALSLLLATPAVAAILLGPLSSGSPQSGGGGASLQETTNVLVPSGRLGAGTAIMCRIGHYARTAVSAVRFVWPGWYVTAITAGAGIGSENSSGAYPVSDWVEYPVGTYTQVDNGLTVADFTNTAGSFQNISIPANTKFYTWHYSTGVASDVPVFTTSGTVLYSDEACQSGTLVSVPTSPSSTLPTDNHSRALSFGPVAIVGPSTGQAVFILGDSRTQGTNDTADGTYDRGDVARSVGPTYNYINAGVAGDDPSMWIGGGVNRRALIQYTTRAVSELGFNLFFNKNLTSASALTYSPWLQGFFAGMPYVRTTIEPYTTSTDSWTTAANQTIPAKGVNAEGWTTAVKTDANFIDLLGPTQDATNAFKWLSASGAITADGVHPNAAGYQDQFATASTIVAAINASSAAAALPTTNFNVTSGSATYNTSTPRLGSAALIVSSSFGASIAGLGGSNYPMTVECFYKSSTASNFSTFFGVGQAYFSQASGTNGFANVRQANGTQLSSTTVITDGNWHHLAYTDTGAAQVLYVDGVSVKTATVTESNASLNGSNVFIGGGIASQLDECAYWNNLHYTGNFTPPTQPYVGNEANLIAVWHFDSTLNGHSGVVLVRQ